MTWKKIRRTLSTANGCFKALTRRQSKLLRRFLPDLEKKAALERLLPTTCVLVFGSSHAHFGWFAGPGEFNCAGASCDLYHATELYRRLLERGCPNVKEVILFYSVFSPGFLMERTQEGSFAIPYRHLWGIPYQAPLRLVPRLIDWRVRRGLLTARPQVREGYLGNHDYQVKKNVVALPEARVAAHLRHNARPVSQNSFVTEMAQLARANGHRMTVVIPPVRSDYAACLPADSRSLFLGLHEIADREGFLVVDCLRNETFTEGDFSDMDHLNESGARKLSSLVRKVLWQTKR